MKLVVDIGNSFTKIALFDGSSISEIRLLQNGLNDETKDWIEKENPKKAIISSVTAEQENWPITFPKIDWLTLDSDTKVPFQNGYGTPKTLGKDRIALATAAYESFRNENVLVIDAGTCVTYDFLSSAGAYLGGAISPGLLMRLKAMHEFTSKLPLVEINPDAPLVGNSTKSSLQSGALRGLAAEINGTVDSYNEQYGKMHVVLSGGDTKTLAPLVKNGIFARPNFLLEGLHAVLAYNTL